MQTMIVSEDISGQVAFIEAVKRHRRVVVFVPNDRIAVLIEVMCVSADANCASVRWLSGVGAIRMFDACRYQDSVLVIRPEMIMRNEPVRADAVVWADDIPTPGTHGHKVYEEACRAVLPIHQRSLTAVTLAKQYHYVI